MPNSILAVLAHPDDETFMIGGTLALYASRGHHVHVLYGPFGPESDGAPSPQRLDELQAAANALGIAGHTILPAGPTLADVENRGDGVIQRLAAAIAAEIRERRPNIVITFDATGGTGNIDHILMGAATLRAVESLRGITVPRLYAAVFGRRLLAAGLRLGRLRRQRGSHDLRGALQIARESQRPTTLIDVRSALGRRREAARCYVTALEEGAWWMRRWELLSPRLRRLIAPQELYAQIIPPPRAREGMQTNMFGAE